MPASDRARSPLLVHVTTVPLSLLFLRGQIGYMRARNYEIHAVSSPGAELALFAAEEGVIAHPIPMLRRISPLRDLVSIGRLIKLFRRLRPTIAHGHTPKGGLVSMIAARIAGVPVRVYHMRGLPLEGAHGLARALLWCSERVACSLAHRVIAVSESVRAIAIRQSICAADRIVVFQHGSGNGVDAAGRYAPLGAESRATMRAELHIADDAFVIGFVGRLVRDKGLVELYGAWQSIRAQRPEAELLLIGPWEERDPLPADVVSGLIADPRVHITGMRDDVRELYGAMDVVALPTYREGFPNVALEAAAMQLPIVATRVTGCVDAVVDGVTGLLVPAKDAQALGGGLLRYAADADLARRHGHAARVRVLREFRPQAIWQSIEREYRALMLAHVAYVHDDGAMLDPSPQRPARFP